MSETTVRAFRREKIESLSISLIGKYIVIDRDGLFGFKSLYYVNIDGDEDFIKIKDILGKDLIRIKNLFSILDDLVVYDSVQFENSDYSKRFWHLFVDDVDDVLIERGHAFRVIGYCEPIIKCMYGIIGANDYLCEKENSCTFGQLLFNSEIDSYIQDGRGRFDQENPSVKALVSFLLYARNKLSHNIHYNCADEKNSIENSFRSHSEFHDIPAIVLVLLLHMIDYHYDTLDEYFRAL